MVEPPVANEGCIMNGPGFGPLYWACAYGGHGNCFEGGIRSFFILNLTGHRYQ